MIVDAALPLILEHGERVTTRQIADAAGIAEGTIFRAFTDKDDVIQPSSTRPSTPLRSKNALAAIDLSQPFEKCLDAAIAAIQRRVDRRVASDVRASGRASTRPSPARSRRARRSSRSSRPTRSG